MKHNGIKVKQVKQIVARIRVSDIGYTLVENKQHERIWF